MRAFAFSSLILVPCASLLLALSSASCKDDPPAGPAADAGSQDGGATLSAEAESFLTSLCARYATCCNSAATKESCTDKTKAAALGKAFDLARAKTCLDGLSAESQKKRPEIFCVQAPDTMTCGAVFKATGAKAPGSDCTTHEECKNGDAPDVDGLCLAKKCQQVKRGVQNNACIGTRFDGRTSVQLPSQPAGGAICLVNDNLYCDETAKQCKPRGSAGSDCSLVDGACIEQAYCSSSTKQCTPRTDKGKECAATEECTIDAYCANDEATNKTLCKPLGTIGAACERGDECDPREALQCNADTTKCGIDVALYDTACLGSLALKD